MFDFEGKKVLKREELVVLFRCCICALQAMCGKKSYPSILTIEKKIDAILKNSDMGDATQLTLLEFQSLISKDLEILQLLKSFNLLSSDDLREVMDNEKDEVECDSDIDLEIFNKTNFQKEGSDLEAVLEDPGFKASKKREINIDLSKKRIWDKTARPVRYVEDINSDKLPNIEMEIENIYGIRCSDLRQSLKISPNGELIFFSGKAAIVLDRKTNTQKIFQDHIQQISCMATCDSLIASSEFGADPAIHIWDYKTLKKKRSLRGIIKNGVSHMCFSNDKKKLAVIDVSENHTVVIYDFVKILAGKAADFKELVVSISRGPKEVGKVKPDNLRHDLRPQ